jgi:hypothetical protein
MLDLLFGGLCNSSRLQGSRQSNYVQFQQQQRRGTESQRKERQPGICFRVVGRIHWLLLQKTQGVEASGMSVCRARERGGKERARDASCLWRLAAGRERENERAVQYCSSRVGQKQHMPSSSSFFFIRQPGTQSHLPTTYMCFTSVWMVHFAGEAAEAARKRVYQL